MFPQSFTGSSYSTTPFNHTGCAPRLLLPGETAYIDYVSATAVPLNISTEEGTYELDVVGDQSVSISNTNACTLQPNNTTVTAGAIDYVKLYIGFLSSDSPGAATVSGYRDCTAQTAFNLADGLLVKSFIQISTKTTGKTVFNKSLSRSSATQYYVNDFILNWLDTTTVWTSLGTITFPFAQSGKIVIRRII